MNLRLQPRRERGSATLVVLALLFIMAALALENNRTLRQLRQELNLLEQRQLKSPEAAKNLRTIGPVGLPVRGEPMRPAEEPVPTPPASPESDAPTPAEPAPETQPEP
jgi:hypothetical protein